MKSARRGASTSVVEVVSITPHGLCIRVNREDLFLSFEEFPWFRDASSEMVRAVEMPSQGHLYWPCLDIDLAVECIRHPERFPLVSRIGYAPP